MSPPDESGEVFEVGLLVCADDMGLCAQRDSGILSAFSQGIVSSASLLVTGSTAQDAARRAKEEGLMLGLHLNLTEGPPVSLSTSLLCRQGHKRAAGEGGGGVSGPSTELPHAKGGWVRFARGRVLPSPVSLF
mmetsp:Transcript_14246/g.34452  ORF Transcript_14246/g.34452 Transcript_14246/m.34452 type:complete len:133 (+) Transcript_14246:140-538(+)